jgi:hypothetical protein
MKNLLLVVLLTFSASSFANQKMIDVLEAGTQAVEDFKASSNADKAERFNGIKAWPVSGGVKVKVYVKGSDSEDYSCHRHTTSEPFECH